MSLNAAGGGKKKKDGMKGSVTLEVVVRGE